jgi:hypothetical protein
VEIKFVSSLIDVIYETVDAYVMSVLSINNLTGFNRAHGLRLDPHALCLYGCLLELRTEYMFAGTLNGSEVIIDNITKATSKNDKAKRYLASDVGNPVPLELLSVRSLEKGESAKCVLPIQAADLIAWEMRKMFHDHREWDFSAKDRSSLRAVRRAYEEFAKEYENRTGERPRFRKSLAKLRESPVLSPRGLFIDRERLEILHARHPEGWR